MKAATRSTALLAVPAAALFATVLGIALHTASAVCEEAEKPWDGETDCGVCHLPQAASLQDPQAAGAAGGAGENAGGGAGTTGADAVGAGTASATVSVGAAGGAGAGSAGASSAGAGAGAAGADAAGVAGGAGNETGQSPCLGAIHGGAGARCTTCHQDPALEKVHANASAEGAAAVKRLKKTKVPQSVCISCHDEEALANATAGSDALVDAEGTVFNPHAFPQIEKHKKLSCVSCHTVHETAGSISDAANAACTKCHHEGAFRACNSCHDV